MSKNLKLILCFVIIGAVVFFGYQWYYEPNTQESGTVKGGVLKTENINQNYQNQPRLIIISPQNGERVHAGVLVTRYLITGDPSEVLNLDILLNQSSGGVRHYVVPHNSLAQGAYPLPDLAAGEYNLITRLVKKDGNYFEQPGTQTAVFFIVEN